MAKKNKDKRKPRKDLVKQHEDLTIPISIELLGTEDDPCFGKLNDPRASECQRCGDCEICAIVMGQNNHVARMLLEKKQNFKDIEETKINSGLSKKVIKKSIRARIRTMAKEAGKKGVQMEVVVNDIFGSYSKDGFTQVKIKKLIKSTISKSDHLTLNKNKVSWQ